jgi:SAM-dependent methyltransferase
LGHVVEFGSGYGAFTLAAARRTTGTVFALDIEPSLIAHVQQRATAQGVTNIQASVRDFVAEGIGLASATQTHAMVYNLLHLEEPVTLLAEAYRVLRPGGRLSVIHWRRDIPTPRGPSLAIRPSPQQCKEWIAAAGYVHIEDVDRYDEPSVFAPENLLREARWQKAIPADAIPRICVLDPDGDIVRYLRATGQASLTPQALIHATARRWLALCYNFGMKLVGAKQVPHDDEM